MDLWSDFLRLACLHFLERVDYYGDEMRRDSRGCYHRLFGPWATGYNLFPLKKKKKEKKKVPLAERLMIKRAAGLIINGSFLEQHHRETDASSRSWQPEGALLHPTHAFPPFNSKRFLSDHPGPIFFFFPPWKVCVIYPARLWYTTARTRTHAHTRLSTSFNS